MKIKNPIETFQKERRMKNAVKAREAFDSVFDHKSQLSYEEKLNAFLIWWRTWSEAEKASVLYQELGAIAELFCQVPSDSEHRETLNQALKLTFSADVDSQMYAIHNGVSGDKIMKAFVNGEIPVGRKREELRERKTR